MTYSAIKHTPYFISDGNCDIKPQQAWKTKTSPTPTHEWTVHYSTIFGKSSKLINN